MDVERDEADEDNPGLLPHQWTLSVPPSHLTVYDTHASDRSNIDDSRNIVKFRFRFIFSYV